MTVIAYRDGVLAADTLATVGDLRAGTMHKLRRYPGGRCALVGDTAEAEAIVRWLQAGRKGDMPQGNAKEAGAVILVPDRGRIRRLEAGLDSPEPRAPFYAWGSGSQVAVGAMEAGAGAEAAVRAAIRRVTSTGGRVQVLEREKKSLGSARVLTFPA